MMLLRQLCQAYPGHWIHDPVGNNAFSFKERSSKSIYVPSIIQGDWQDVQWGHQVVFGEILNGVEVSKTGLAHYVYWQNQDKHIFIVDNHNHVFSFWILAIHAAWMPAHTTLVHVDQHRDTREPAQYPSASLDQFDVSQSAHYAQYQLNVGNFIPPALRLGVFDRVEMVLGRDDFTRSLDVDYCLDLDLDIFDPVLDYIPESLKLERIRQWIKQARVITIATSPYFIEQTLAKKVLNRLFDNI